MRTAYAAQIKLDELRRQFGDRGGTMGYAQHVKYLAARFDHADFTGTSGLNMPCTSANALGRNMVWVTTDPGPRKLG